MYFQLIKTKSPRSWYGSVPTPDRSDESQAETFEFDWDDMLLMLDDFVGPINTICDTLFDLGDVDYIPSEKCADLARWIEVRKESCQGRALKLYEVLLSFAMRAIDLGTGIVVEL